MLPPTCTLPPTPIPPATINAPEAVVLLADKEDRFNVVAAIAPVVNVCDVIFFYTPNHHLT